MTVPPLSIPGPDDRYVLLKADKLPVTYFPVSYRWVTGNLPPTYVTGNLTTLGYISPAKNLGTVYLQPLLPIARLMLPNSLK